MGTVTVSRRILDLQLIFFIVGGLLLTRLDEQEGMRVAMEEDAAFAASAA
jgi:hypothetical protein